jgi:hypothetical protein
MFRLSSARIIRSGIVPVLLGCLALGCGSEKSYRVTGKVTFKGQPVPTGKIYFMPDGAKGNSGPTGFADIKDGRFDTSASGGRGTVGGPVIIAIEGIDPAGKLDKSEKSPEVEAKALFPRYEIPADLPKSDTTKDIDVPAEAVTGGTKQGGTGKIIIP